MSSTTSINDLPVGSSGNNAIPSNNITLETTEHTSVIPQVAQAPIQAPTPQSMPDSQKQHEMNQVVSGIQQASAAGSTLLPSRDIPQDTLPIVQDDQSRPTFIPDPQDGPRDYITDPDPQHLLDMQKRNSVKREAADDLYSELQIPILISILYLLFQLPITHKFFKRYMPPLFNVDGNQNTFGYLILSGLFGLTFYSINLLMDKFSSAV